jgi:flagellar basal body rod protein FlgG
MSDGLYVALGGAVAQVTHLETVATNLANASTDGYHSVRPVFHEVLNQARSNKGTSHHVAIARGAIDTTPGAARNTGRELDVVLPPTGYLTINTPRGERYTRAGALTVAADGTLRAPSGDAVVGDDRKPIKVDPTKTTTIGVDGSVLSNSAPVAKLSVVTFAQPDAMVPEGATVLAPPPGAPPTPNTEKLTVGALEESNASPVHALTDLLSTTRAFEAFQRTMDAFRDADRKAVTQVASAT